MSGWFVGDGEFRIAPVDAGPGSADPQTFTRLHLQCLETAYARIIDEDFGRRIRAEAESVAAEDRENLAAPATRAVIAWANPGFGQSNEFGCCSIGADPDLWFRPVGLALSTDGPQPWEAKAGAEPLPGVAGKPPRTLVTLYVLPEAQGRGLGGHLLDAVLGSEEPDHQRQRRRRALLRPPRLPLPRGGLPRGRGVGAGHHRADGARADPPR